MADQVFTRESLINDIAEEVGGEGATAEFVNEETTQEAPKQEVKQEENLEAQPDPDVQSLEDIANEAKPETEETPVVQEEVAKEPLSLEHIYGAVEEEVRQQPSITKDDIKAVVREAIEPYLESDSTEADKKEAVDEAYEKLTPQQIQKIVQDSLVQHETSRQEAARVEAATNREIENYEKSLYQSLEKSGITTDSDPVLDAYIKDTFGSMLDKVSSKLGTVYPGDIKEIARIHAKKVEQLVNKRRPDYVPPKAKTPTVQAGSTTTPTANAPAKKPVNTLEKLDAQAQELAKKSGGKLSPSLASAYMRGRLKATGGKEIKF